MNFHIFLNQNQKANLVGEDHKSRNAKRFVLKLMTLLTACAVGTFTVLQSQSLSLLSLLETPVKTLSYTAKDIYVYSSIKNYSQIRKKNEFF